MNQLKRRKITGTCDKKKKQLKNSDELRFYSIKY